MRRVGRSSLDVRLWMVAAALSLPLYAFAVLLALRSGFFDFSARPLQDAEVTAFWAFTGAALGATVTLVVAVINRNQAAMSERRLTLDSATAALKLLDGDGPTGYASPAVVAGSLATLINLGQPSIAVHTLEPVWRAGAIDSGIATWVLGEGIKTGSPGLRRYACYLLRANTSRLVDVEKGTVSWPPAFAEQYPSYLTPSNRVLVLETIALLLMEQPPEWWRDRLGQMLNALSSLMVNDPDPTLRADAARIVRSIRAVVPADRNYVLASGIPTGGELVRRADALVELHGYASVGHLASRLEAWSDGGPVA